MALQITDIKPLNGSQKEAFEELVCQIVRRTNTKNNTTWRRLHGAGGDGGVEAIWADGQTNHGLQAKWFLKTADIGWAQIEKSFKTALKIHPELSDYHIYLACDLTGPTGRKTKSGKPAKNGTQLWEEFEKKLLKYAATQSVNITLHLHTLSDVLTEISRPNCVGLAEFWFGEIEFSKTALEGWYKTAEDELGERYSAIDNVQVSASASFNGLIRDNTFQLEAESLATEYVSRSRLVAPDFCSAELKPVVENAENLLGTLFSFMDGLTTALDEAIPYAELRVNLRNAQEAFQRVQRVYWDIDDTNYTEKQKSARTSFRKHMHTREEACDKLHSLLSTHWTKSDEKRAALFVGPAGIGKSHLLADQIRTEIHNEGTALLFLGHWFSTPNAWETIAARLGKPSLNKEQLLGAIDAVAAAKGRRAIIAIDALNESKGGNWIRGLCSFAEDILKYPNLTLAVSCRDVYVPYVIHANFYALAHKIQLLGFVNEDEIENAAKVFLDKRGIVRPSLLWLAPEFSNPLFLKASALALHKQGKTEYPKGLRGSKEIFSFFIESIGSSLGTPHDGSPPFQRALKNCLSLLAKAMADNKDDYIAESLANKIISSALSSYPISGGWLEALCKGGLLDKYPPYEENADPFNQPEDQVRFAYQRLQDHLMAEALLKDISKPEELFGDGQNSLQFMTSDRNHLEWRYWGLMEALSIQVAEKFNVELMDYYLDYCEDDFIDHSLAQAFIGSLRWRQSSAISDRTIDLMHRCARDDRDLLSLIVEFTFRDNHRLNAEKLHKVLLSNPLPERDAYWTVSISQYFSETVFERLLMWSLNADKSAIEEKYLLRAATTVAWMLSSTSQYVRDHATKALSSLYVDAPQIFPKLVELFKDVDDPYILERIFLSAYGYLLRTGNESVLGTYADAVAYIFASKEPIPQLYVRDYARSIIELAIKAGVYDSSVPVKNVRPPYSSKIPCFNATEKQVEAIANARGGNQILRSCSGMLSDFKKYELDSDMRSFIKVPLSKDIPLTTKEKMDSYEKSLPEDCRQKILIDELSGKNKPTLPIRIILTAAGEEQDEEKLKALAKKETERQQLILNEIYSGMTTDERKIFRKEWLSGFNKQYHERNDRPRFDNDKVGYWVARRAYALGWTEKRFGKDNLTSYSDYSRSRPPVERIGKKYQWIARSELLARLADNYWVSARYEDEKFKPYNHPLDLGYERDIDPSLFDHTSFEKDASDIQSLEAPIPQIDAIDGVERLDWSFNSSPASGHFNERVFTDSAEQDWIRLSWFAIGRRRREGGQSTGHNLIQEQFYFLNSTLISEADGLRLIEKLEQKGTVDIDKFKPREYTDYPYLYECGISDIWPNKPLYEDSPFWPEEDNYEFSDLVEEYAWESHLDKTMPKGQRVQTLASWVMRDYGLSRSVDDPRIIIDSDSNVVARYVDRDDEEDTFGNVSYGIIAKVEFIENILKDKNKTLFSVITGERQAWPDGASMGATTWRRFNAMGLGVIPDEIMTWDEDNDHR